MRHQLCPASVAAVCESGSVLTRGRSAKLIAWSLQASLVPEETHLPAVVEGPVAAMQVLPQTLLAASACAYVKARVLDASTIRSSWSICFTCTPCQAQVLQGQRRKTRLPAIEVACR